MPQALAHKIDLRAINQRLAQRIDIHAHPVLLTDAVAFLRRLRKLHLVAPTRATGALDTKAQAERIGRAFQKLAHTRQRSRGQGNRHAPILHLYANTNEI